MLVRALVEQDIPQVVELAHTVYLNSRYNNFTFDREGLRSLFEFSLTATQAQVFVVIDDNDKLIGAIGAIVVKNPWFHELFAAEQFFAIDPSARGYRAAMLLLRAYKNWAVMSGARVLNVFVDHGKWDDRVAKLYKHAGFVRNGESLAMRIEQ